MNQDSTQIPVITIDGPSASGKGTVSREVALQLGWHMLDSGALYRLTALAALQRQMPWDDEKALKTLALSLDIEFLERNGSTCIMLDGEDVSDAIRSEQCSLGASQVAVLPAVRDALLARQRAFLQLPGLVADGRDMGSVVFPQAQLKIFITASAEERANRRYKQLKQAGNSVNLADLLTDIQERDRRDSERSHAPLKPPENAEIIDTTSMTVAQVVQRIMSLWHQRESA